MSKEPFRKSFAEIADLTDYQIYDVLFRPEKEGSENEYSVTGPGPQELFAQVWHTLRGLSRTETKARWVVDNPTDPWTLW